MNESTIGIRELKARLSETMRRVKAGETIVITERGEPIGRLVPEGAAYELSLEEKMQRLMAAGLAEWNGQQAATFEPVALIRNDVSVADLIAEMRE